MIFAILLSVVVTSAVSAAVGMAGGMILMGVYALLLPVAAAMTLHGISQFAANGFRAVYLFGYVEWRGIRWFLAGSALSLIAMVILGSRVEKSTLFILMGSAPLLVMPLRRRVHAEFTRPSSALVCGVVVTATSLMAGVAGPLLDLFFSRTRLSRHAVVATKAVSQTISHGIKIGYYGAAFGGVAEISALGGLETMLVGVIVCSLLGTRIGGWVLDRMSDRGFKAISQALIQGMSVVYLCRGISMRWGG